jgi:UDP:flavonoid glycosyltransferase YjiC (YdhE family)
VQETGHGFRIDRYDWTEEELLAKIEAMLTDAAMKAKLAKISAHMQSHNGQEKAADLLVALAEGAK